MPLAKSITHKIINKLHEVKPNTATVFTLAILAMFFSISAPGFSQDNSPYSRYGIGDLVQPNHIINRGMGGISAGYVDYFSINFNNPASYSSFQAVREQKSKKLVMGRAILDVGLNFDSRTLTEPGPKPSFTSSNGLFSYVHVGVPLKYNWGLSFGLRPLSRVSYNIVRNEVLKDPVTGMRIDSAITNFTGTGGAYMATVGTGKGFFEKDHGNGMISKLSVGVNASYLFGGKDYSTRRSLINDTVAYYQANYETKTNFGSLYFDAGIQYRTPVNKTRYIMFTAGAYGNWGQDISATQDILRETFQYDPTQGNVRLDSVSDINGIKGKILLPSSYTVGFVIQKPTVINKESGWLFGSDFTAQQWDKYRFYGQVDSVRNSWLLKIGAQFNPIPKRTYFSNISFRLGFFMGPDYIRVRNKMQQLGGSLGLGLPIAISRQAPNQVSLVNLSLEYGRRGNDENLLRESLFRFSLGFSLSDFWFIKRKYD